MKIVFFVAAMVSLHLAQAQCPNANRDGVHVIQAGETLYRLSKQYNVSVADLLAWNGLMDGTSLKVCQELKTSAASMTDVTPSPATAAVVSPTTMAEVDAVLEVEAARRTKAVTELDDYAVSSTMADKSNLHIVEEGETVASLAERFGYTEARFREINEMRPFENVYIGREVVVDHCGGSKSLIKEATTTTVPANTTSTVVQTSMKPQEARVFNPDKTTKKEAPSTIKITSVGSNPTESTNSTEEIPVSPEPIIVQEEKSEGDMDFSFMSSKEHAMIDEINLVRSDPKGYVRIVQEYIEKMNESGLAFPDMEATANELIGELNGMSSLSVLKPKSCLYDAAKSHGIEAKSIGESNHNGVDGSWPWDRARRACSDITEGNENLVGGPPNVRESVLLLLIDAGIPNRGHRKTMLDPSWKWVACYESGMVGRMPNSWVQMYGR